MKQDFPDDATGDALRRMHGRGDSLTMPRDIDFSIMFPDEVSAKAFAARIEQHFHTVEYHETGEPGKTKWDVTATRLMLPSYGEIVEMETLLQREADPWGGYIDGWGCFSA
ncbi:ribonuclease E inhibitor RraB [Rhizobium herbae]|uniref:Regulator of ribonuclease activity B domain-containing protein n=1 Tax=Rhizobium herbae TaxID=508661 RepID=A0ABS4EKE1_9HYPH|nr:ribonuclease E inhibitor RraB [Rhizobium herbae]MBP1858409.1 hypothetical protein [Rhizobium herbae]